MKVKQQHQESGLTLIEVLISVALLAAFFASVFEVNAVCLRYIDATKESVAALQSVHDRVESLRNQAYSDLTTTSYVQGLMGTAANTSDFCKKATETVKIRAYPTANGVTQYTRSANGAVTLDSTATSLGSTLVQIDVSTTWNLTLGGRSRSEQTSTIISNGSKK
jgi:prepilin-type N-terminal cleavage/methylation domain-containing protein